MTGKEETYIEEAFRTNWIAPNGPNVDAFEKEAARLLGVQAALAVQSGTAAIHLALELLGVGKEDTVFCSSLTFVASANPILYQGATPVFIDSEPDTWNMSPIALERALKEADQQYKLPKAIIVVHLYGQPARVREIKRLADQYGVPLVEDAAESLGSLYHYKPSGTHGAFGIYSFNGNKIITTSGGGMIVSDDEKAIEKARFYATQAKDPAPYYQHSLKGYNYRMSNILAGVGRAQLEVLELRVAARRKVFEKYEQELSQVEGFDMMPELTGTRSNRWLTALTIDDSKTGVSAQNLINILEKENIEARRVWKPLHLQPLFKDAQYYPHFEDQDVSTELFNQGICLPSGSGLTTEEQHRVLNTIRRALPSLVMNKRVL
ncbi:DegT/DnrJ/EryC1/StrS family aminotransferase [Jeotgalibacillus aurantiacus]|uniref:DegT/DnrJ/EryC1/StrS family aminotransferase n=1 Tax=Jeotgalibacillus aurantiacus TaxID=2763266 RepID=UPI0022221273|nr:aminotransferase class I/II-fold pyridoxal phosphate-dependent enzyme [Jeotgalibacillus aurantiacus]